MWQIFQNRLEYRIILKKYRKKDDVDFMKTGIRMSMQAGAVGWIFRQVKRRICLVDNFLETDRGGHLHVSE